MRIWTSTSSAAKSRSTRRGMTSTWTPTRCFGERATTPSWSRSRGNPSCSARSVPLARMSSCAFHRTARSQRALRTFSCFRGTPMASMQAQARSSLGTPRCRRRSLAAWLSRTKMAARTWCAAESPSARRRTRRRSPSIRSTGGALPPGKPPRTPSSATCGRRMARRPPTGCHLKSRQRVDRTSSFSQRTSSGSIRRRPACRSLTVPSRVSHEVRTRVPRR
mmetsp:Transcript_52825/g.123167  ORF Transcript_52825/g.123167 Transcript_52825/m.123167 type:complete len:221 (-) Transcript_52825:142-804(-)